MRILWKEWRQQRWLFWMGCVLGITYPVLEGLGGLHYNRGFYTNSGSGVVLGFGALFAIILAVATTHSDVKRGICDFWQSKPVSPTWLFGVKFLVASMVLLTIFLFTESLDFVTRYQRDQDFYKFAWSAFCYTFPIAIVMFSVTMFVTILTRDSAKSVLIAIWIALLVYFLPLLMGGLSWLNVFELMGNDNKPTAVGDIIFPLLAGPRTHLPVAGYSTRVRVPVVTQSLIGGLWRIVSSHDYVPYLYFLAATAATSVGSVALSIVAAKRRWLWQPGQKTIVWTLGLSAAFIFGLSMFQVGHNLQPAKTWNGRPIDPVVQFNTQAENTFDWLDPKTAGKRISNTLGRARLRVDGDLMFVVGQVGEPPTQDPDGHALPVPHDWFVDIYRHPGIDGRTEHLSRVRFFSALQRSLAPIVACFVRNNRLYIAYQLIVDEEEKHPKVSSPIFSAIRLSVADISDPAHPKRIDDREIYRPASFGVQWQGGPSDYGNYCYVGLADGLLIISVADPDRPAIVRKIAKADFGLEGGDFIPNIELNVIGDKLVCVGDNRIMILGLADPEEPKKLLWLTFPRSDSWRDNIRTATYANNYLYVARLSGITVHKLQSKPDGLLSSELVGQREATPLERLTGRYPYQLVVDKDRLFEAAGPFGVLVYDVSNPARPKRVYHGGEGLDVTTVGTWNGLFYIASPGSYSDRLMFLDIPARR
jgi:hypothetical protein